MPPETRVVRLSSSTGYQDCGSTGSRIRYAYPEHGLRRFCRSTPGRSNTLTTPCPMHPNPRLPGKSKQVQHDRSAGGICSTSRPCRRAATIAREPSLPRCPDQQGKSALRLISARANVVCRRHVRSGAAEVLRWPESVCVHRLPSPNPGSGRVARVFLRLGARPLAHRP